MSLVDDARRLAEMDPFYEHERAGTTFCIACGSYERQHHPNCPILSLPRIVAALEAAERLTQRSPFEPPGVKALWTEGPDWETLIAALRSEEASAQPSNPMGLDPKIWSDEMVPSTS